MKKSLRIDDEYVRIVKQKRKFLSLEFEDKDIELIPIHLIKMVQKAYKEAEGTVSFSIFLETENEFLVTYDEAEDIDAEFEKLIELKEKVKSFRVEIYNVDTCETVQK